MKRLTLPLKKQWFDMIKSGEKKEEYRSISDYWRKRLIDKSGNFKRFDIVTFTCGYPSKYDIGRFISFVNPSITTGEGKTEWGAEPGKQYFVITWEGGDND